MKLQDLFETNNVPTLFFPNEIDEEFNDYLYDNDRVIDNVASDDVPNNLRKAYVITTDPAHDYRGIMPGRTAIEPDYAVWVDEKNRVYLQDLVNISDTEFAVTDMGIEEFEMWARKAQGGRAH